MVELEGLVVATTFILCGGGLYAKLKSCKKHEGIIKECECKEELKVKSSDVKPKVTLKSENTDKASQTYYISGVKTNCKNLVVSTKGYSVGYIHSNSINNNCVKPQLVVIKGSKKGYNSKPKSLKVLKSA